jgi:hypothetical protein
MGLAIQTDGDADDQADVRVVSTRAAGSAEIKISVVGGVAASNVNLAPGAAAIIESVHATQSLLQFVATDNGGINGPGFALFVTCKANNHGGTQDSQLYCMATRSSA